MDDLEKLAKGLTRPQRRAVLHLTARPQRARTPVHPTAAFNLFSKGITKLTTISPAFLDHYHLTPLGLALRAHIEASAEGGE